MIIARFSIFYFPDLIQLFSGSAAGAIELSDEQLNEINGGSFWDKVKEQAKKAAKETTDTGNLSLY